MKKIGVITWFKYHNYGTILQAVALQKYLLIHGYKPELINFEIDDSKNSTPKKHKKLYECLESLLLRISNIIYRKDIIKKNNDMDNFVKNNCEISELILNESDYIRICNGFDYIIFGSDQIWNPNWYHPFYFGAFKNINAKYIAYAPSIGVHKIPDNMIETYKQNLNKFSFIGMREKYAAQIINSLVDKSISNVIDPVFLLDKKEWMKYQDCKKVPKECYILCYMLSDNAMHWKAIMEYSRKLKKKIVVIPVGGHSYFKTKYTISDCNINDFIGLINNASEIITDSFHGSAFSLIFNKQFRVFERHNPNNFNSQNARIYNLLDISGLKNNNVLIKYNSHIIETIKNINYDEVNVLIGKLIVNSQKFINDSLR